MLQLMYNKDGETQMPSSAEQMDELAQKGWSTTPPTDPNALPEDLPLLEMMEGLSPELVRALFSKLTVSTFKKIKDALE